MTKEKADGLERALKRPALVLLGPTASGKTDLLLELFARAAGTGLPPVEIVSADSMQAYRGMDIGTAKPGPQERGILPHHLIDIRDPEEAYTVGDFVDLAGKACAQIAGRGALPVLAGGTGFYVRNFIFGLPGAPAVLPAIRDEVAADMERRGPQALREELLTIDPGAAARIHPNDRYRISRACEILRQTGRPPSDFAPGRTPRGDFDFLLVEVSRGREELYARIDARVDLMFGRGLPAEVAGLVAKGHGPSSPGMKAIGYSEFFGPGHAGEPSLRADLDEVAADIKLDSRHYAKRQETYFRGLPCLVPLEVEGRDWLKPGAARLGSLLGAFLSSRASLS